MGRSVFVTNNYENKNIAQTFGTDLSIEGGSLKNVAGNSLPHSYSFGSVSEDGNTFLFHANAAHQGPDHPYTDDRTTVLSTTWTGQPTFKASPASAVSSHSWDGDTSTLELHLSHAETGVDVIMGTDANAVDNVQWRDPFVPSNDTWDGSLFSFSSSSTLDCDPVIRLTWWTWTAIGGGVTGVALAVLACYCCIRRRKKKDHVAVLLEEADTNEENAGS